MIYRRLLHGTRQVLNRLCPTRVIRWPPYGEQVIHGTSHGEQVSDHLTSLWGLSDDWYRTSNSASWEVSLGGQVSGILYENRTAYNSLEFRFLLLKIKSSCSKLQQNAIYRYSELVLITGSMYIPCHARLIPSTISAISFD